MGIQFRFTKKIWLYFPVVIYDQKIGFFTTRNGVMVRRLQRILTMSPMSRSSMISKFSRKKSNVLVLKRDTIKISFIAESDLRYFFYVLRKLSFLVEKLHNFYVVFSTLSISECNMSFLVEIASLLASTNQFSQYISPFLK